MIVKKLNNKEQLILNELVHKHHLAEHFTSKGILELHRQLVGNLKGRWLQRLISEAGGRLSLEDELYNRLICPLAYPSMIIRKQLVEQTASFYWKNRLHPYLKQIEIWSLSVGRLVSQNTKGMLLPFCSGFRVETRLLMTVAAPFLKVWQTIKIGAFKDKIWVDFSEDKKVPGTDNLFEIQEVVPFPKTRNHWLFLKLSQSSKAGHPLPPPLAVCEKAEKPEFVVAIGYPMKIIRSGVYPLWSYALFGSPWQIGGKRLAPGHQSESFKHFLYHDCCVSNGSEGSPLIHPASGRVIGMQLKVNGLREQKALQINQTTLKNLSYKP